MTRNSLGRSRLAGSSLKRGRQSSELSDVLQHVERALEGFWRDKGFGEISIVSERNDREGFRVFVKVTTSERMIVHERDAGD